MSGNQNHGDQAADFHNKEMPKIVSNYIFQVVITKKMKKMHMFLKESKYIEK